MDVLFDIYYDDSGFIVSIELVLISTIAVIGLVSGLAAIRDAVVAELSDVAGAIQDLNQSYEVNGVSSSSASSSGFSFVDRIDFGDDPEDVSGQMDNCIIVGGTADEQ